MADVHVSIACEGLGELLHFVNERARQRAKLSVGGVPGREDVRPEGLDACDLRLAQAVRMLSTVNAGLSVHFWRARRGTLTLHHTAEACGEKGLRCIQDYAC